MWWINNCIIVLCVPCLISSRAATNNYFDNRLVGRLFFWHAHVSFHKYTFLCTNHSSEAIMNIQRLSSTFRRSRLIHLFRDGPDSSISLRVLLWSLTERAYFIHFMATFSITVTVCLPLPLSPHPYMVLPVSQSLLVQSVSALSWLCPRCLQLCLPI